MNLLRFPCFKMSLKYPLAVHTLWQSQVMEAYGYGAATMRGNSVILPIINAVYLKEYFSLTNCAIIPPPSKAAG